ncbi:MAG: hypothetical protein N4A35_09085 [Flavobacteriales bacterium]|jgi:AcrR family transcriptional regulator|nr:hypothetical protein [Flavobacteriales bacterium]
MVTQLEKLHTVALGLFKSKGIESTTIYDIALASKIPYSVLDEKYPSTKELIFELFSIGQDNMFQFVYGDLAKLEDFKAMMRTIFHQSVLWAVNNSELFCFMDYISQPYQWETEDNKIYPRINETIMARVEIEIKKGNLKDLPIDFAAHIMTKMLGACVSYIVALNPMTEEEFAHLIEPMFETCWDALKA